MPGSTTLNKYNCRTNLIVIFYQFYQILPAFIKNSIRVFFFTLFKSKIKAHFSQFVSQNDLVFDVGANTGDLSQIFLELGARVICIEPQPSCIKILKKRYFNNPRVTIVEKGLSDDRGQLPFFISSKTPALSTFSRQWCEKGFFRKKTWDQTIGAETTTLDALIEKYGLPAFCKIDVEGFEEKVIKGLSQPIPALSFEFNQWYLNEAKNCADYLASLGNPRFNYSLYNGYTLFSKEWLDSQQLFTKLNIGKFQFGDIYVKFPSPYTLYKK